ncbi:Probable aspartic proteinase GIP1 [Linum perenne]
MVGLVNPTNPYTLMESLLYMVFKAAYLKATTMINMRRVKPVSPFDIYFSRSMNDSVPAMDLALQSEIVKRRTEGSNSMVSVDDRGAGEVACLGILEGGSELEVVIVIGGPQMEDRVMEFDLDGSRLRFSSHLCTMQHTTCSHFISLHNRFLHNPRPGPFVCRCFEFYILGCRIIRNPHVETSF